MRKLLFLVIAVPMALVSCKEKEKAPDNNAIQAEVQTYLEGYNAEYQKLATAASEGQWVLNTYCRRRLYRQQSGSNFR